MCRPVLENGSFYWKVRKWHTRQIIINLVVSKIYFPPLYYRIIFKGALSGLRQFLATEISLKMVKNAFYFTLKALFVHEIFKFFLDFLDMWKNDLIRKTRLFSKFMTSQPGKQTLAIHTFPISWEVKAIRQ